MAWSCKPTPWLTFMNAGMQCEKMMSAVKTTHNLVVILTNMGDTTTEGQNLTLHCMELMVIL